MHKKYTVHTNESGVVFIDILNYMIIIDQWYCYKIILLILIILLEDTNVITVILIVEKTSTRYNKNLIGLFICF